MINLSSLKLEEENDAQFWKNLLKSSELHNKELSDFIEYLKKSVADQKEKNKELVQENHSLKSQLNIKDSIISKMQERVAQLENPKDTKSSKTSLKGSDHEFKIYSRLEETKRLGAPEPESIESDKMNNLFETAEKLSLTPSNFRSNPTEVNTPPPRSRNISEAERFSNFFNSNNTTNNAGGIFALNLQKTISEGQNEEVHFKKEHQRKNCSQYQVAQKEQMGKPRDNSLNERECKALNKSTNDLAATKVKAASPCEGHPPIPAGANPNKLGDEKTSKKGSRAAAEEKGSSKENGLFPIYGKIKKRSQSKAADHKKKPPVISPKGLNNGMKEDNFLSNATRGITKAATLNSKNDKFGTEGVTNSTICYSLDQPNILDKYNKINEKMDNCLGKNKNMSLKQENAKLNTPDRDSSWGQCLFETFMIIGLAKQDYAKFEVERQHNPKNAVFSAPPSVLYKQAPRGHLDETFISQAAQFAFPKGVEARRCEVRDSQSEMQQILLAKNVAQFSENCFVFTLNSQATFTKTRKTNQNQANLQITNPDHRYYCICIKVKDIHQLEEEKSSKHPRGNEGGGSWISEGDSIEKSGKEMVTAEREFIKEKHSLLDSLLGKLSSLRAPFDNKLVELADEKAPLKIPPYTAEIHDFECWSTVSILALSNLSAHEFVKILSLVLQEHSVIFVSVNSALLSSTILSILLFMRPFRWPYPCVCSIPQVLNQILDCPFPIIGGLNLTPSDLLRIDYVRKYPQCVFINLDNEISFSNLPKEPALSGELSRLINDLNPFFDQLKRYKEPGNKSDSSHNMSISSNLSHRSSMITNTMMKSPTTTQIPSGQKLIYDPDEFEKKAFYKCIDVIKAFFKREILEVVEAKDALRLSTIWRKAERKDDCMGEFTKKFLQSQMFSFFFDENLNKSNDSYIKKGEGLKSVRKIFSNVVYDPFEEAKIKELEELATKAGLIFPPEWTKRESLIYCYSCTFKMDRCLKTLKEHLEWRRNPIFHVITNTTIELLKSGLVYQYGRDKQYRPVLIYNLSKVNTKKFKGEDFEVAFCVLEYLIKKFMFIPGKIENWIVIIDCAHLGLWSIPLKLFARINHVLGTNFTNTMERLYVINIPSVISTSWKLIEKILDPETKANIKILTDKEQGKLMELVPPEQLEKKYGGLLPNLEEFWPPKNSLASADDYSKKMTLNLEEDLMELQKDHSHSFKSMNSEKDLFFSIINESEHPLKNSKSKINDNNESAMMQSALSNPDLDQAQVQEPDEQEEEGAANVGVFDPNAKILERLESNMTRNIIKDFLKKKGNSLDLHEEQAPAKPRVELEREIESNEIGVCSMCRMDGTNRGNCLIF